MRGDSEWGNRGGGNVVFLGALITRDGLYDKEIRRRIAMDKAAMGGITTVWKDRGIKLATQVKLARALMFPIVLNGAETWTMRKADRKTNCCICRMRVMGVSWMERRTNVCVVENIKPERTLESMVAETALGSLGHVVREEHGMDNDVMLGEMSLKRRRGRPRTRWLDNVMLGEMSRKRM